MMLCYIAIGSNLDTPLQQAETAVKHLCQHPELSPQRRSRWYCSEPLGPPQPDYINGVVELSTELPPHDLLAALQHIENRQGRERNGHWGPRTLDLDILLYGNKVIDTPDLQIPHPQMSQRNFVLTPLADLNASLILPNGETIGTLLAQLPAGGLSPVETHSTVVTL